MKKIYVITQISTDPFLNGRMSKTRCGLDADDLIKSAYSDYFAAFNEAKYSGRLYNSKESPLDFRLFTVIMNAGFTGYDDVAVIMCEDSTIEFEATAFPLKEECLDEEVSL